MTRDCNSSRLYLVFTIRYSRSLALLHAYCYFPVAKRHTEDGIIVDCEDRDDEKMKNIFADIPDAIPEEIFETIIETESFRLERIVSDGQLTA